MDRSQDRPKKRISRRLETCERTGLSWSTIRRLEMKGEFPKRVQLGPRSVGHFMDEIDEFLAARERVEIQGEV